MKDVSNILQISHLHFEHLAYFRWCLFWLSWSVAKAGFQLSSSSGMPSTLGLRSEAKEYKQRDSLIFHRCRPAV